MIAFEYKIKILLQIFLSFFHWDQNLIFQNIFFQKEIFFLIEICFYLNKVLNYYLISDQKFLLKRIELIIIIEN
jgi:hypothetical protein